MLKKSGFSFGDEDEEDELDDADLASESSEDAPDVQMYAWPRFQLSPDPSQVPFPDFLVARLPHLRNR